MYTYSLYIHDTRYSVSTLDFAVAQDETKVREIAQRRLEDSPAHVAVDVWSDDALLFSVRRNGGETA